MTTTTGFEFGDVVLVPFPFTDHAGIKKRPAVVASSAAYHRERSDLIILAVTSHRLARSSVGEATVRHWQEAGLLKASVVKPILATVDRKLVLRKLGRLHPEDRSQVQQALDRILGEPAGHS